MSKNFSGQDFSVEAMAITLTEMRFRGLFFRIAESFYLITMFLYRRNYDNITIGVSQVRYIYWKEYFNRGILHTILLSFSIRKSYEVAKYYIDSKKYISERELLEGYNGRPSRVYVKTFRAHRRRLLNVGYIRSK